MAALGNKRLLRIGPLSAYQRGMPLEQPEVTAAIRGILAHLMEHPEAMDTVEGISLWWLSPEQQTPQAVVDAALSRLVGDGWMKRSVLMDGRVAYTITARGLAEAGRYLRRTGGSHS